MNKHIRGLWRKALFITATIISFSSLRSFASDTSSYSAGNYRPAPRNIDQQKLLALVNNARAHGCNCGNRYFPPVPAVTWNARLEQAALDHSKWMARTNYLSHSEDNGSSAGDRIKATGYTWRAYGENIAAGYPTEEDVIRGWLKSEHHCMNIMNGRFKEMGVAAKGSFWTQVFATP